MGTILKDFIIGLLPPYIIDNDSYKDGNQQGFVERFMEIFGEELDDEYYDNIEGIIDLIDPFNTPADFLDYIAFTLGDLPNISTTDDHYRNILSFIISIYRIKGTIQSFKSILTAAKVYTTVLTEIAPVGITYDNGGTYYYDDGVTIYDDNCIPCSSYDLTLTGTDTLTAELYLKILNLIKLVEPINANLRNFTYNTELITEVLIAVWVDSNGDLQYNNDDDPGLILTLDEFGNLIISGPQADQYYISNGDLYYLSTS